MPRPARPRQDELLPECRRHPRRLAGELKLSISYFELADEYKKDSSDSYENRVSGLMSKTWVQAQLGHIATALSETHDLILASRHCTDPTSQVQSLLHHAHVLTIAGDVEEAASKFKLAERRQRALDSQERGLVGLGAIWWAELMLRAGVPDLARRMIEGTIPICVEEGWGATFPGVN